LHYYFLLILGVACAAAGGDLFVRGAVGIARAARISGAIIGATVAAFATSSPELAVAVSSATAQRPQIALGDALGSSVVNVALILGLVLVISPIHSPRTTVTRDFPVALAVPIVTAVVCLDGTISRIDGALMLCLFGIWFIAVAREALRQRDTPEATKKASARRLALYATVGLVLLFMAGQLIVSGARGVAQSFGISEFVIGATIVAVGTSVPELATAVIAKWRGHDEVSLGTMLGSNIFNGLWIVPVAAIIYPIDIEWPKVAAALIFGLLTMAIVFPPRDGVIGRDRGMVSLLLYVSYVGAILIS
jgi:cation:H+ antiporter